MLASDVLQSKPEAWLLEHGPTALESLFRAIVNHPSALLLIANDHRDNFECALSLLDAGGRIVAWYPGAERVYGYSTEEAAGSPFSRVYPDLPDAANEPGNELQRATAEGHFGNEGWHVRKDGSRFWANAITMALARSKRATAGFCPRRPRFQRTSRKGRKTASQPSPRPAGALGIDHRRHRIRRVRPHSRSQRCVSGHGGIQPRGSVRGSPRVARPHAARIRRARRPGPRRRLALRRLHSV